MEKVKRWPTIKNKPWNLPFVATHEQKEQFLQNSPYQESSGIYIRYKTWFIKLSEKETERREEKKKKLPDKIQKYGI